MGYWSFYHQEKPIMVLLLLDETYFGITIGKARKHIGESRYVG
jgi:hypothetical protein